MARLTLRAAILANGNISAMEEALAALREAVSEQQSWMRGQRAPSPRPRATRARSLLPGRLTPRASRVRYDEPPDWHLPVRQCLGRLLLRAGRPAEAHETFEADLRAWPENGWSLWGLRATMLAQPASYSPADVAAVAARMAAAWRDADVPLVSSCAHFDEPAALSARAREPAMDGPGSQVQWFGFWDPDAPSNMSGLTNLAFCDASAESTAPTLAAGIQCLFSLESEMIGRAPNGSHQLVDDFRSVWSRIGPPLCDEVKAKRAVGFFLGDELVSSGLWFDRLVLYADLVKKGCPESVVYYNEGFAPIFEMGQPWVAAGFANASRYFYPHVPGSLDWVSWDMYPDLFSIGGVRDFTRWTLFQKMAGHQRAVLVPPSYGDRANASVTASDCDGADCDASMALWASEMALFAASEPRFVAIMPFKWRYGAGACDKTGRRCVGAADLPRTRATWERVGRGIVGRHVASARPGPVL